MSFTLADLRRWMESDEDEHLEFKEAKQRYDFGELVKYCAALANERGGKMVLGVTNKKPRSVVGTAAFQNLERTKAGITERLHLRVEAAGLQHTDGRVVIFDVPSRPIGYPINYKGAYWMRAGEDLVPMTQDQLKRIFEEAGPDFSAEICRGAMLRDLDAAAIEEFRARWMRKSGNSGLGTLSPEQLLRDADLLVDDGLTFAGLILLGTNQALRKYLPQGEVVFEYRSSESSIPYQQRNEFRQGFFQFHDALWERINLRNDVQHFRDGLFVWNIPTFNEDVVREAILNAVSHRNYRLQGSVFIRQYPRKLEIVSPGGFPPGVTPETILFRQSPTNRRLAEALARCGLVERSGQGADLMFKESIKESKPVPDFGGTDAHQVALTLRGEVQDPRFLRFLEQIGEEKLASFAIEDLLVLDLVHREQPVPEHLRDRLRYLVEQGVVETVGRGRGSRQILSRDLYEFLGKKGVYTRKRGLDRETNKELLLKHIQDNEEEGSRLPELMQVLPSLSRHQVQFLMRELRAEGRIHRVGRTKGARWYPGTGSEKVAPADANEEDNQGP